MSTTFLGRRSRTKSDLSMKMYEEEIQVCGAELDIVARLVVSRAFHTAWKNKSSFETQEAFSLRDPGTSVKRVVAEDELCFRFIRSGVWKLS